jgi:uncharacterized membrane protein
MASHRSDQELQERSGAQTSESAPNGAACYAFGILVPLLYLSVKPTRTSAFLRFHSFQCLILFCVWIPLLFLHAGRGQPIVTLLSLLCLTSWLTAMVKAGRGKPFRIPGIGALAERLAAR